MRFEISADEATRKNVIRAVSLILFIFLAAATIVVRLHGDRTLAYALGAASLGVVIANISSIQDWKIAASNRHLKLLEILSYVFIVVLVWIAEVSRPGISKWFYVIFAAAIAILTIRVLAAPQLRVLIPIILTATILRSTYWNSAAVLGRDFRHSLLFAEYIIENGEIIPPALHYYHYYPVGHTSMASISLITDVPIRVAAFLSIGLAAIAGIVLVSMLTRRIVPLHRGAAAIALLAAIFLTTAPLHIVRTSTLHVQALSLLFFPLAMYGFVATDRRLFVIGLLGLGIGSFGHNSVPIITVLFGAAFTSGSLVSTRPIDLSTQRQRIHMTAIAFGWLVVSYTVTHLFGLQTRRVMRLLLPGGLISEVTQQSAETTTGWFLTDPAFLNGLTLLFGITILAAASIILLSEWFLDTPEWIPEPYYVAAALLTVMFGVILAVAMDTNIRRLTPNFPIIIAPLVGLILWRLSTAGKAGTGTAIALIVLLPSLIFVSAAGPGYSVGDAPTEPRPDLPRKYITHTELEGANTANQYTRTFVSDEYMAETLSVQNTMDYHSRGYRVVRFHETGWPTDCNTIYFRTYAITHLGIVLPSHTDRLLDAGPGVLYSCTG